MTDMIDLINCPSAIAQILKMCYVCLLIKHLSFISVVVTIMHSTRLDIIYSLLVQKHVAAVVYIQRKNKLRIIFEYQ